MRLIQHSLVTVWILRPVVNRLMHPVFEDMSPSSNSFFIGTCTSTGTIVWYRIGEFEINTGTVPYRNKFETESLLLYGTVFYYCTGTVLYFSYTFV